jgi:protein-disulfide isomerase
VAPALSPPLDESVVARVRERLERDLSSARESGATGTPAFFVNGRLHDDAYDAGSLVAALTA